MTLLEEARKIPANSKTLSKTDLTDEDLELIVAYFKGEITLKQVRYATRGKKLSFYIYVLKVFQYAVLQGYLKIPDKEKGVPTASGEDE